MVMVSYPGISATAAWLSGFIHSSNRGDYSFHVFGSRPARAPGFADSHSIAMNRLRAFTRGPRALPGFSAGGQMKKSVLTATALGFLVFMTVAGRVHAQAPNQSAESQAAQLRQISAELRRLRLEVIQQAIDFQNWKIARLERELQPIQNERRGLSEREQAITQLVAEFNNHRTNTATAQEAVEEMEAMKAAYTEKELKK